MKNKYISNWVTLKQEKNISRLEIRGKQVNPSCSVLSSAPQIPESGQRCCSSQVKALLEILGLLHFSKYCSWVVWVFILHKCYDSLYHMLLWRASGERPGVGCGPCLSSSAYHITLSYRCGNGLKHSAVPHGKEVTWVQKCTCQHCHQHQNGPWLIVVNQWISLDVWIADLASLCRISEL